MAARIVRRTRAKRDVVEAFLYIADEGPNPSLEAADRLLDRIHHTLEILADNPELGRQWETGAAGLEDLRWFPVVSFPKYLVFYQPIAGGIRFTRLLHGSRDIPSLIRDEFGE